MLKPALRLAVISFCLFYLTGENTLGAQDNVRDLQALHQFHLQDAPSYYNPTYGNNKDLMLRGERFGLKKVVAFPLSSLMFFYQNMVSPQLSSDCQFSLTCSNYAKHAFAKHGLVKGLLLTIDRLYRCNANTHDHVPSTDKTFDGKTIDTLCD